MTRYQISRNWRGPSQLSIWKSVLFVDWHGVLSESVLWSSIAASQGHPYQPLVSSIRAKIFDNNPHLANRWMTGKISSEYIASISDAAQPQDARFGKDFVLRRLMDDCRSPELNKELMDAIRSIKKSTYVVVATDNMDCFTKATLPTIERIGLFDGVICSSDVGVLKSESPDQFFGKWLNDHGIRVEDAVLIDDGKKNCNAFAKLGGRSIFVPSYKTAAITLMDSPEFSEWI